MILCCSCRDYSVQHTAMASLLELVNHSQSLALVIQDKHKRYQRSDSNPLSGRLQMVTVPPIFPAKLGRFEEGTDFYQVENRPCFFCDLIFFLSNIWFILEKPAVLKSLKTMAYSGLLLL